MELEKGEMAVGTLAKELGISTATINFYVTSGVLPPPRKVSRTRAAYSEKHKRILKIVRRMQGAGCTLNHIKNALEFYGTGEDALRKLEDIGYLQPIVPQRNDPDQRPIDHFEPVERRQFLAMLRRESVPVMKELERVGLLRPVNNRYDARDLFLVRSVQSLLDEGVQLERVLAMAQLTNTMRELAPAVFDTVDRHSDDLRTRKLRMRDIFAPYQAIVGYLFDRALTEHEPHWRDRIYGPG